MWRPCAPTWKRHQHHPRTDRPSLPRSYNMAMPREVAVAIPVVHASSPLNEAVSSGDLRVYLVSSRKHEGRFVLPKGGVEHGESSRQAAVRELWEEAGLIADPSPSNTISRCAPEQLIVDDHKPHKQSPVKHAHEPGFIARARYSAHELVLTNQPAEHWPEAHERTRRTFTLQEAERELEWRKDVHSLFKTWLAGIPSAP
ncbi:hypothetical protein PaG_03169 [Moesziomyces aphidis]|uniref:Nudix hydrolase domain-containing protein n=1 Tax=Moesziomyces aphidis TaxID=84754 RepID=W3VP24_MOEAP|nr:hypothetical protein PaG_03169 [Moesziomyces aphidis]